MAEGERRQAARCSGQDLFGQDCVGVHEVPFVVPLHPEPSQHPPGRRGRAVDGTRGEGVEGAPELVRQPLGLERGEIVGAAGAVGEFVERTSGECGDEVEGPARRDMRTQALPYSLAAEGGHIPAVRVAVLPLDLMHLRPVVVPVEELDPVAQWPTRFDAERRARSQQYVQGMSDCPGPLVAVAELVRLATRPRYHRAPPPTQTGRARARTLPQAGEARRGPLSPPY